MRLNKKIFFTLFVLSSFLGVTSCSLNPTKIAVSLAQAPIAESLLIEYLKDDEKTLETIEPSIRNMRLVYDDMLAADTAGKLADFVKDQWWRVVLAKTHWSAIKFYVLKHANQTGKKIPDGLLVFNANVEAGFAVGAQREKQELWEAAGVEAMVTIGKIVAAKNGIPIN